MSETGVTPPLVEVVPMPVVANDVPTTPTRVSSCSVHFPLDSVRFDEKAVAECFKDVKADRISYIHVIATASPDGTNTHNLYLSTRRAGAIEGYLRNRYPDVEIHAFGGGANPKSGKMARIFVVEGTHGGNEGTGQTPVIDTTPVAPVVQVRTEIKYREPPKVGASFGGSSGLAAYNSDASAYQYAAFTAGYQFATGLLSRFEVGARYGIHRSNQRLDIHTYHLFAHKRWDFKTIRGFKTEYGGRMFTGLADSGDVASDVGVAGYVGARAFELAGAFEFGVTRHFRWVGVSIGSYI